MPDPTLQNHGSARPDLDHSTPATKPLSWMSTTLGRHVLLIGLPWLMSAPTSAIAAQCQHPGAGLGFGTYGDINGSGTINVADAMCAILAAIAAAAQPVSPSWPTCLAVPPLLADLDCSGTPTVSDVQVLVGLALGFSVPAGTDANGDGCPDACGPAIGCGDGACAGGETCTSCPSDCGDCPGACCDPITSPGCGGGACETCVCGSDDYCCDVEWDAACTITAATMCDGDCVCSPAASCCAANGGPGCEVPTCVDCTCVHDPLCCQAAWDDSCTFIAASLCSTLVGQSITASGAAVAPPVATAATATFELELVGGETLAIAVAHTATNPTSWALRSGAPGENGPLLIDFGIPAANDSIQVSLDAAHLQELIRGHAYLLLSTLAHPSGELRADITLSATPGPCGCSTALDCCEPHGQLACGDASCAGCVCALDPFCCAVGWDFACAVSAAEDCDAVCGCATAEPCCVPHGGAGCQTPRCEHCVCTLDAFCCDGAWDAACVAAAQDICSGACGCPMPSGPTCCGAIPTAGCGQPACVSCVCTLDSACCTFAWDESCARIAADACRPSCGCPPPATGSCCAPLPVPGCGDPACESCVCGIDSWCCDVLWDESCAGTAVGSCSAACPCPP